MTLKKQDLIRVIASRANAIDYWSFMHYLPNPDPVLKKMGKDISAYREILSDSHVGGCVRRRKAAIKGLEWRITPTGNEKTDEILTALFDRLPMSHIISQILDATLFGYQALEVMWESENGLLLPTAIVGKPQEWFVFDEENQLMLRTKDNSNGALVPEKKFLLATQQADFLNPYGRADLAMCFWAATFKKGGFKFWLEFMEKYGSPWLVGKHPRQAQIHEIDELLDSMEKMLGTAVAAIPEDSSIDLKESASKGASSQVFDDFLRYCKSEIAIALLGQNQTTEAEANRASASAGLEVTRDIRNDDASLVEGVFNQLLSWICELNFSVDTLPTFELFEQESIDKLQAERDKILTEIGVSFTEQYIHRTYDFEEGDIVMQEISPNPSLQKKGTDKVDFAEPIPKSVIETIGEQLEVEGEVVVETWLHDIRDRLGQAESLEDFRNQLDSLIPELSYAEYGELLAWGSTAAQFAGRQSVEDERTKSPSLVKRG
nr:MAG TPA: portal [Caudoviricetes sp.]